MFNFARKDTGRKFTYKFQFENYLIVLLITDVLINNPLIIREFLCLKFHLEPTDRKRVKFNFPCYSNVCNPCFLLSSVAVASRLGRKLACRILSLFLSFSLFIIEKVSIIREFSRSARYHGE